MEVCRAPLSLAGVTAEWSGLVVPTSLNADFRTYVLNYCAHCRSDVYLQSTQDPRHVLVNAALRPGGEVRVSKAFRVRTDMAAQSVDVEGIRACDDAALRKRLAAYLDAEREGKDRRIAEFVRAEEARFKELEDSARADEAVLRASFAAAAMRSAAPRKVTDADVAAVRSGLRALELSSLSTPDMAYRAPVDLAADDDELDALAEEERRYFDAPPPRSHVDAALADSRDIFRMSDNATPPPDGADSEAGKPEEDPRARQLELELEILQNETRRLRLEASTSSAADDEDASNVEGVARSLPVSITRRPLPPPSPPKNDTPETEDPKSVAFEEPHLLAARTFAQGNEFHNIFDLPRPLTQTLPGRI